MFGYVVSKERQGQERIGRGRGCRHGSDDSTACACRSYVCMYVCMQCRSFPSCIFFPPPLAQIQSFILLLSKVPASNRPVPPAYLYTTQHDQYTPHPRSPMARPRIVERKKNTQRTDWRTQPSAPKAPHLRIAVAGRVSLSIFERRDSGLRASYVSSTSALLFSASEPVLLIFRA